MKSKVIKELTLRSRVFIKERILISSVSVDGQRYRAHRALNLEEYIWKYKDAIEEAERLAIENGLDPKNLQSSVCPNCQIPVIWEQGLLSNLLCLKCGRRN